MNNLFKRLIDANKLNETAQNELLKEAIHELDMQDLIKIAWIIKSFTTFGKKIILPESNVEDDFLLYHIQYQNKNINYNPEYYRIIVNKLYEIIESYWLEIQSDQKGYILNMIYSLLKLKEDSLDFSSNRSYERIYSEKYPKSSRLYLQNLDEEKLAALYFRYLEEHKSLNLSSEERCEHIINGFPYLVEVINYYHNYRFSPNDFGYYVNENDLSEDEEMLFLAN